MAWRALDDSMAGWRNSIFTPLDLSLEVLLLAVCAVGFLVLICLGGLDPNSCAVWAVGFVVVDWFGGG